MTDSPTIVLFDQDLRMADNPALSAAVQRSQPLICLYIWDPESNPDERPGAAGRWWLHHSLQNLDTNLRKYGNRLIIRTGRVPEVLSTIIRVSKPSDIFWNRSSEPSRRNTEKEIDALLDTGNVKGQSFWGTCLADPAGIHTQSHQPYRVFTPFWSSLSRHIPPSHPLPAARTLPPPPADRLPSDSLDALQLLPKVDWAQGIRQIWRPGEEGARAALRTFLRNPVRSYATERDRPDHSGTSRLSPHLHFGEISPRMVWHTINRAGRRHRQYQYRHSYTAYLRQLGWREFARYLLYHFPHTIYESLHRAYETFPWRDDADSLRTWQKGQTGYPIVDAGMRELWHTGWMHNRIRMVTASFLTKDLLISWRKGAEWFRDTLVDADLANNTLGWQWVAGCGADASPFFRIFNPVTQGLKYDPDGEYVRRWVPELAKLPAKWIHHPWEAPHLLLKEAGVRLGETYPHPMLIHQKARDRALASYRQFKKRKALRNMNGRTPHRP